MWLFTKYGFISAVTETESGETGRMKVRARAKCHLQNILIEYGFEWWVTKIECTPLADYAFRVILPREVFVMLVQQIAGEVDYFNFKDECHLEMPRDVGYQWWLSRIWSDGATYQHKCAPDARNGSE